MEGMKKSFQESLGHWVRDPSYLEQESLNGSLSALGPNQSGNTTKKMQTTYEKEDESRGNDFSVDAGIECILDHSM